MRGPAVRPIVIAAGGTGGHLFPAEALAAELLARGERVALMTDARSGGLARARCSPVPSASCISGAGIAGRGALRRGQGARWRWPPARCRRAACCAHLHAAAVVGFGGYPCVPPVLAALPDAASGRR